MAELGKIAFALALAAGCAAAPAPLPERPAEPKAEAADPALVRLVNAYDRSVYAADRAAVAAFRDEATPARVAEWEAACRKGQGAACTRVGLAAFFAAGERPAAERYAGAVQGFLRACDAGDPVGCGAFSREVACAKTDDPADCHPAVKAALSARPVTPESAAVMAQKACEAGVPVGCRVAAGIALDAGRRAEAVAGFLHACELGSAFACGHLLFLTRAAAAKEELAARASAAKIHEGRLDADCQASPAGCAALADAIREGLFGKPDLPRARRLYERACEAEGPGLACVRAGDAEEADDERKLAASRYRATCEKGRDLPMIMACSRVGAFLVVGDVLPRDEAKGLAMLQVGCDKTAADDDFPCFALAKLLEMKRDKAAAIRALEAWRAAERSAERRQRIDAWLNELRAGGRK
jgi:hypothetical protein